MRGRRWLNRRGGAYEVPRGVRLYAYAARVRIGRHAAGQNSRCVSVPNVNRDGPAVGPSRLGVIRLGLP